MNLIVVEAKDFIAEDAVRLTGRRFEHWRDVLKGVPGGRCKVGKLGGDLGEGVAAEVSADAVTLRLRLSSPPPAPSLCELVLALPRPKTMRKVLFAAVGFGVARIRFIGAWKVEKSYWQSPWLEPEALHETLLLALEQAADTRLPEITFHRRFKPFVEDELPGFLVAAPGLLAHPGAVEACPGCVAERRTLILGPEGGFTDYEAGLLAAAGARPVSLGPRILRTEVAVAALLGRMCCEK